MPFSGIPEGSELESKIDRCLESVMAKQPNLDKSAAIAICRDSIPGASREKANFGARVGEQISGRLGRVAGGRFGAVDGDSKPIDTKLSKNQLEALSLLVDGKNIQSGLMAGLEKLGLAKNGQLTINGKAAAAAIAKGQSPDKFIKAAGEGGGKPGKKPGGGGKGKPSQADNIAAVSAELEKSGMGPRVSKAFTAFMDGVELDDVSRAALTKLGLLDSDGKKTKFATALFSAMKKGDTKAALSALQEAKQETTKDRTDAIEQANYRSAGPASTFVCQTCTFADIATKHCTRWDFVYDSEWVCDSFKPDIPLLQARGRELASEEPEAKAATGNPSPITAHGPGGLFSQPMGVRGHGRLKDLYMNIIESIKQWFGAEMPNLDVVITKRETPEVKSTFKVITGKDGAPRWVAISSNAFKDRDEEIVSTKALNQAVDIADSTNERGPLRFWHVPGFDIGDTDFQMVHGRMLIETGGFKTKAIGERIAANADELDLSIGFNHPATEPDSEGVFHNINIFERSIVPSGRAANRFTSLTVKEQTNMADELEKVAAFRDILGDEAEQFLEGAEGTQKEAEETTTYKEVEEPTQEQLMELWNAYKEVEAENVALTDDPEPEPETPDFEAQFNAINERMTQMAETIEGLATATKATQEGLSVLADDQPRALKSGFRASQSNSTLTGVEVDEGAQTALKEVAERHGMGAATMMSVAEKFMNTTWGQAPQ